MDRVGERGRSADRPSRVLRFTAASSASRASAACSTAQESGLVVKSIVLRLPKTFERLSGGSSFLLRMQGSLGPGSAAKRSVLCRTPSLPRRARRDISNALPMSPCAPLNVGLRPSRARPQFDCAHGRLAKRIRHLGLSDSGVERVERPSPLNSCRCRSNWRRRAR